MYCSRAATDQQVGSIIQEMYFTDCNQFIIEFIRIGYYVSNDYTDPEMKENNPSPPQWDKLQRNILATNPR